MKFLKIIFAILLFATTSCNKDNHVKHLEGVIKVQGTTTYQYGTHVLTNEIGQTLFALQSDKIKLDDYVGENVEISGSKVDGYPIDGGPDLIKVSRIK